MRSRWIVALITLATFSAIFWPRTGFLLTVAQRTAGYILIQVEKNGEAWYVYPKTLTRFFLGRPADAFDIMRRLGLGISNANLAKIPVAGSSDQGDAALRTKLSGYILIQVEKNGEAWYVYPKDTHRYYLGRPDDAYTIMRRLGLGTSDADLGQIPVDVGITYKQQSVATSRGTFTVDWLKFDRKNPAVKVMTDTGNNTDCATNCTALSLGTYVTRRSGVAGIHGTYFCPPEYADCKNQTNFYFFPVFNSFSRVMINTGRIKFTTQPMIAFDTGNKPYFFHDTRDFKSPSIFESTYGVTLRSAISNGPALIENNNNILDESILDSKQATVKSFRGALGYQGDFIYLLIVRGATVIDSAAVLDAIGLDFAINLDGGGSAALYNAGRYIIGPGRNLPNAIVITQ